MRQLPRAIVFTMLAYVILTCAAPCGLAQGVRYNDIARTAHNTPLSNGTVAVCSAQPTNPGMLGSPVRRWLCYLPTAAGRFTPSQALCAPLAW